jgi:hypothetical protein
LAEKINRNRRRFLGAAAITIAGARFVPELSAEDSRPAGSDEGAMPALDGAISWLNSAPLNSKFIDLGGNALDFTFS